MIEALACRVAPHGIQAALFGDPLGKEATAGMQTRASSGGVRVLAVPQVAGRVMKTLSGHKQVQEALQVVLNGVATPGDLRAMRTAESHGVQNPGMQDR